MPSSMPHLIVAKKINPNASIDFYIGNIAVDAINERDKKEIAHFRETIDREIALKEIALKADNNYLKGLLLHLYVDWKWETVYLTGIVPKYHEELGLMSAYAFHNTEWAYELLEQMEQWDGCGFVETEFITKENIYSYIQRIRKWHIENKVGPSMVFPPELLEKFVDETANEFNKWLLYLKS